MDWCILSPRYTINKTDGSFEIFFRTFASREWLLGSIYWRLSVMYNLHTLISTSVQEVLCMILAIMSFVDSFRFDVSLLANIVWTWSCSCRSCPPIRNEPLIYFPSLESWFSLVCSILLSVGSYFGDCKQSWGVLVCHTWSCRRVWKKILAPTPLVCPVSWCFLWVLSFQLQALRRECPWIEPDCVINHTIHDGKMPCCTCWVVVVIDVHFPLSLYVF